ncbi:carcinoembryonic antigen-related cell adhesion molecule 1-like [Suncus etruscus]|uniref:carcinoembryonic antigen-related cell adhesion molecule 1-like n=1 Tax=Suncus etruscus TaxID=109475 RepID=UPI00210F82A8|nr:carcinoembryonic antigen-related cell adhesion molecule 1-like [Suncus etruscus]
MEFQDFITWFYRPKKEVTASVSMACYYPDLVSSCVTHTGLRTAYATRGRHRNTQTSKLTWTPSSKVNVKAHVPADKAQDEVGGRMTIYTNGSLLIRNLTVGDKGTYLIQVITESSDLTYGNGELRLYEPLTKPHVTTNNSSPMEQDSVVLTCEPESPDTTFWWFSNTWPIQSSTRLQVSPNNRTLTVFHITRKDTRPYESETSNPVSVHRSNPFILTVLFAILMTGIGHKSSDQQQDS